MSNNAVDLYLEQSESFAVPILVHLRKLIHSAIPEIEESLKWKMPSFELDGKIICSMAGFKKHCVLRFWQGVLLNDPDGLLLEVGKSDMRHIGNFSSLEGLPSDAVIIEFLQQAAALIRE